jgi:hypothetical protein
MRRSYVVPVSCMVIYEYEVAGRALNLSSTKLPRPWSPWESFPWRKNPHGRTRNRTRDLMISSQKLWPLDHEAGPDSGVKRSKTKQGRKWCIRGCSTWVFTKAFFTLRSHTDFHYKRKCNFLYAGKKSTAFRPLMFSVDSQVRSSIMCSFVMQNFVQIEK